MTVLATLTVGDRVLVDESKEAVIIALASMQILDSGPQRPFVKVQYDGWSRRTGWYPAHRIAIIKEIVEVER